VGLSVRRVTLQQKLAFGSRRECTYPAKQDRHALVIASKRDRCWGCRLCRMSEQHVDGCCSSFTHRHATHCRSQYPIAEGEKEIQKNHLELSRGPLRHECMMCKTQVFLSTLVFNTVGPFFFGCSAVLFAAATISNRSLGGESALRHFANKG